MGKRTSRDQQFDAFLNEMINGIDAKESTEWAVTKQTVSENIRAALVNQFEKLQTLCGERFLDYCNTVKALLAIYNFGNLETEEALLTAGKDEDGAEIAACKKRTAEDKAYILRGIREILAHVEETGYDISPYLDRNDCQEIFADKDGRMIPLTISVTTVLTTLIYFRRSVKRGKLFTDAELAEGGDALMDRIVATVTDILIKLANYTEDNGYMGWGFTLDSEAVTLSDTYSAVDAISRFADAFTKEGVKRDQDFIDRVNAEAARRGEPAIVKRCLNDMYKVAFNTYDRTKEVYGHHIFYAGAAMRDKAIRYVYSRTDYEQISSSNRSSALFNPLYVAMITMYGYNEKELVIRYFMDKPDAVRKLYDEYETQAESRNVKIKISEYAAGLDGYGISEDGEDDGEECDFEADYAMLSADHPSMSGDYSDNARWRKYYRIARVFQKYLETQQPERLMEINEYRDYLNATKDAIDQVQIMYRNFDNNQRLGIVDTDYVMFSSLDVNTDAVNISKLNKANISVNNLRPMLLSSKIMIVNALTKYPQADMEGLFKTILDAQYQKSVSKTEKKKEWLWNADSIDMNSTARHCEAITYDYFDYYERYELGLKAISNLKSTIGDAVVKGLDESGSLDVKAAMNSDESVAGFKRVVLDITRQNVELVKVVYQSNLREREQEYASKVNSLQEKIKELETEKANLIDAQKAETEALLEKHKREMAAESLLMGDTLRRWIREETDKHFRELFSMMILNELNGSYAEANFSLAKMFDSCKDELFDAGFGSVRELAEAIKRDYAEDPARAEAKYEPLFRNALGMQRIFEGALDGILKLDECKMLESELRDNRADDLDDKNAHLEEFYGNKKHARALGDK